ncbi:predicted protein [Histoplasma capsulatum G186AR]|uniref:Uncharacterized protein n=1 Tax=Ajellomyces capsulatus (strain G186AR / H82 / ATCC MYA-2454 / RMSCC 2432) TaxID=447093 RepID=C0ND34_AJECG|nr:uncharacterized protein HCBG_01030 [Histoplasma capsulatum G186AR]EEH11575.1 predicted protein [Histoplasma capsulatum G186AR]
MDKWQDTVLEFQGLCPACSGGASESREEKGQGWDEMPNLIRSFECGHSKLWVRAESLQKCFVCERVNSCSGAGGMQQEVQRQKQKLDIRTDVRIEIGDSRIAEFWEREYLFSEEEASKIQFEKWEVEWMCAACRKKGKGEDENLLSSTSRKLLSAWKRLQVSFQEKQKE